MVARSQQASLRAASKMEDIDVYVKHRWLGLAMVSKANRASRIERVVHRFILDARRDWKSLDCGADVRLARRRGWGRIH